MKQAKLPILAISPFLLGFLIGCLYLIPGLSTVLYYLSPIAILLFWFWVGMQFSKEMHNPLLAVLAGNSVGILSLLIYLWQFVLTSESSRNLILAALSQAFTSPLSPLTAYIALIFVGESNVLDQTHITIMEVSGLVLMVAVFILGYLAGRLIQKKRAVSQRV